MTLLRHNISIHNMDFGIIGITPRSTCEIYVHVEKKNTLKCLIQHWKSHKTKKRNHRKINKKNNVFEYVTFISILKHTVFFYSY